MVTIHGTYAALVLSILLMSCSGAKETERVVQSTVFDFTGYAAKGFMFSPAPYVQPHEPVGLIKVTIIPGTRITRESRKQTDEMFAEFPSSGGDVLMVESLNQEEILNEAYVRARALGADALVQLSVETRMVWNGETNVPTYEVSGIAIRRQPAARADSTGAQP
jgi:uncharacterized protein YbjQ (UPF0145 family)